MEPQPPKINIDLSKYKKKDSTKPETINESAPNPKPVPK